MLVILILLFLNQSNGESIKSIIAKNKCNIQAGFGQFPFVVALLYSNYRIKCTGALLTPQHVISAARCMLDEENYLDTRKLKFVMAGDILHVENKQNPYQELREIKLFVIHPDYIIKKNIQFDMGVIKVNKEFPMSPNLYFAKFGGYAPVTWWDKNDIAVVGWGEFVPPGGKCIHRLHYSIIRLKSSKHCGLGNNTNLFCINQTYGCHGAVGSPLIIEDEVRGLFLETRKSKYSGVAISIYLRIYNHLQWLYQALAINKNFNRTGGTSRKIIPVVSFSKSSQKKVPAKAFLLVAMICEFSL